MAATPPVPKPQYARVVVDVAPAHLDRPFDYLVPEGVEVAVGQQVRVAFAGRRRVGWIVEVGATTEMEQDKIRPLVAVDGPDPWFDAEDLRLFRWVAQRYAGTLADVLRHALPRRIQAVEREGEPPPAATLPAPSASWDGYDADALLAAVAASAPHARPPAFWLQALPGDATENLIADLVARCLAAGRTALVLAPDPASRAPDRALHGLGPAGADFRTDVARARYRAFRRCRSGSARVATGERSAVFAPLRDLGLVVIDDEANPAYKERRSPRHSAREVALARARMAGATCVLLGDLPSPNLWRLLRDGHVTTVGVDRAAQRAQAPRVDVVDLGDPRPGTRRARFSEPAAGALREVVRGEGAGVVLASRGGQGSALACRNCGARLSCPRCAGSLRVLGEEQHWECPACAWEGPPFACNVCGDERYAPLAAGAGRLAAELRRSHPDADVVRMEGFDAPGPQRRPGIGVMTRGSVVARPDWLQGGPAAAVVIPDADALLQRPAFGAAEDTLRLWMAVARWAPRVILQTREPRHHAVQALVRWDAAGFWDAEAQRRAELRLPPATALIGVACPDGDTAAAVAAELRGALPERDEVWGPDLDGDLLVKCSDLRGTLAALTPLREDWAKHDRKVRVDVDPLL